MTFPQFLSNAFDVIKTLNIYSSQNKKCLMNLKEQLKCLVIYESSQTSVSKIMNNSIELSK